MNFVKQNKSAKNGMKLPKPMMCFYNIYPFQVLEDLYKSKGNEEKALEMEKIITTITEKRKSLSKKSECILM
jgi:hypothetical protein